MLIGDFAYEIVQIQNRNRVNLEYIVADSAGKREREELKSL
jgi:hypothetical protein